MRGFMVALCVLTGCFQDKYDVDDYWTELANAHCTAMELCCTRAEYTDWWTESDGDRFECVAAHDAPTNAETIRAGVRSGKIMFDVAAARSCVIALENLPCTNFQPAIRYRETYCTPPLRGRVPLNAGCTIDVECETGYCSVSARQCRPRVAEGGDCSAEPEACVEPLRCQSGRCGLGAPSGATCSADSQCIGDWCKDDGIFSNGTCYQACQTNR